MVSSALNHNLTSRQTPKDEKNVTIGATDKV